MKSILLTLLMFISICNTTFGQNNYTKFYNKYEHTKGVESFEISPFFLRFLLTKDDADIKMVLNKINKISFFISDSTTPEIKNELIKNLPKPIYQDLIEIKDGNSKVLFKIKTSEKKITELLMVVSDNKSLVVMCLKGKFSIKDAKSLANSININNTVNTRQ